MTGIVLEVPDLGNDAIVMRPWREADAPSLSRAWHDPAVIAGSTPPPDRSEAVASRWISGWERRRLSGRAFDLVIAAVDDDRVLGEVGLSQLDAGRRAAAIGWWVHEEARRRGVASAAVRLCANWALSGETIDHLVAEIGETNHASQKVAAQAGFVQLPTGIWHRGTT